MRGELKNPQVRDEQVQLWRRNREIMNSVQHSFPGGRTVDLLINRNILRTGIPKIYLSRWLCVQCICCSLYKNSLIGTANILKIVVTKFLLRIQYYCWQFSNNNSLLRIYNRSSNITYPFTL